MSCSGASPQRLDYSNFTHTDLSWAFGARSSVDLGSLVPVRVAVRLEENNFRTPRENRLNFETICMCLLLQAGPADEILSASGIFSPAECSSQRTTHYLWG
jgi:hypothetical protein